MENPIPESHQLDVRKNCDGHLGKFGAVMFLDFINLSGLPTGRLYAWAKILQAIWNPGGKGVGGGKLARTDMSKWRNLALPDGKTVRQSEGVALEFTVSHSTIKANRQKLDVLLVFERVSETMLIYTARKLTSWPAILTMLIELEREALQRLALPLGSARKNLLWMPNDAICRELQAELSRMADQVTNINATEPNAGHIRSSESIDWGSGRVRFHPDDWTCRWLRQSVLSTAYVLPAGLSMKMMRSKTIEFVEKFNARAQVVKQPEKLSPVIFHRMRSRQIKDRQ